MCEMYRSIQPQTVTQRQMKEKKERNKKASQLGIQHPLPKILDCDEKCRRMSPFWTWKKLQRAVLKLLDDCNKLLGMELNWPQHNKDSDKAPNGTSQPCAQSAVSSSKRTHRTNGTSPVVTSFPIRRALAFHCQHLPFQGYKANLLSTHWHCHTISPWQCCKRA